MCSPQLQALQTVNRPATVRSAFSIVLFFSCTYIFFALFIFFFPKAAQLVALFLFFLLFFSKAGLSVLAKEWAGPFVLCAHSFSGPAPSSLIPCFLFPPVVRVCRPPKASSAVNGRVQRPGNGHPSSCSSPVTSPPPQRPASPVPHPGPRAGRHGGPGPGVGCGAGGERRRADHSDGMEVPLRPTLLVGFLARWVFFFWLVGGGSRTQHFCVFFFRI